MKRVLFLLLLMQTVWAAPPFTVENLNNLRIVFMNSTDFIDAKHKADFKADIAKRLSAAGITLNGLDPRTFFVKIEAINHDKTSYIYVQIGVGEEVITHRKDAIETLALTYQSSDFIESEQPLQDTNESLQFLMDEFLELYKADN
jgi:hypothetical protein